jgi:threonine/homoserine/homoserine lactone efflux protein
VPAVELIEFLVGYCAVLATPGPNLFAIGSMAALHGLRGVTPLCVGAALGAGTLSAALLGTAQLVSAATWWRTTGSIIGAAMLLWVAFTIGRQGPPEPGVVPGRRRNVAAAAIGFLTAATNPVTGAFFAASFLGPLAGRGAVLMTIPPLVTMTALSFFLGASHLLSRPAIRAALQARHRPIRLAAAAVLVFMAAFILGRGLARLGWRPPPAPFLVAWTAFLAVPVLLLARPLVPAARLAWHRSRRPVAAVVLVFMMSFAVGGALVRLGVVQRRSEQNAISFQRGEGPCARSQ